jgi:hypothetical protein
MSSTAPLNTTGEGSSAKYPESEAGATTNGAGTGGFQAQSKMTVQPPKTEDLQRSYARVVTEEANPKGWYGSMSKSLWSSLRSL